MQHIGNEIKWGIGKKGPNKRQQQRMMSRKNYSQILREERRWLRRQLHKAQQIVTQELEVYRPRREQKLLNDIEYHTRKAA